MDMGVLRHPTSRPGLIVSEVREAIHELFPKLFTQLKAEMEDIDDEKIGVAMQNARSMGQGGMQTALVSWEEGVVG